MASKRKPEDEKVQESPKKQKGKEGSPVKMKSELITIADESVKSGNVISFAEAQDMWKKAGDGPGVTQTEFATLEHILNNYKFTKKARAYLDPLAFKQTSGSSLYKTIDGVKYDRSCIDLSEHLAKDGSISLEDAKQLWKDVEDGGVVTAVEKRTIDWIIAKYKLTDGAKKIFDEKLAAWQKAEDAKPKKAEKEEKKEKKEEKEETVMEKPKKCKQDLLDFADESVKSAGVISFDEANKLWKMSTDGPGVTATEFATLQWILQEYKFTKKGRGYLDPLANKQSSGTSMYKKINGTKYDRSCLDLAAHLAKDGSISQSDAQELWKDVMDGNVVTPTEKRTIEYVMGKYKLTDGAKKTLDEKLAAWQTANNVTGVVKAGSLLSSLQKSPLNALTAKTGSHLPLVETVEGGVKITIPHGKKPTDDHWIQWIFVGICKGEHISSIVYKKEISFADSDKPSVTIKKEELAALKEGAKTKGKLHAFEYCTKDGFWKNETAL